MVSVGLLQSVEGLLKKKRAEVPQEEGFPAAGLGLWTESRHPLFPAGLPAEFARQPHGRVSRFPNVNLCPSAQAVGPLSPESPDQYHCLPTLLERSGLCSGGCRGPAAPRPQSCRWRGPGLLPRVLALRAERGCGTLARGFPWLAGLVLPFLSVEATPVEATLALAPGPRLPARGPAGSRSPAVDLRPRQGLIQGSGSAGCPGPPPLAGPQSIPLPSWVDAGEHSLGPVTGCSGSCFPRCGGAGRDPHLHRREKRLLQTPDESLTARAGLWEPGGAGRAGLA